jgi:hypothetical protein
VNPTSFLDKNFIWSNPTGWYWYALHLPMQIGLLQTLVVVIGLGYYLARPSKQRIFLLIWILSTYLAFCVISNKDWRYTFSYIPALTLIIGDVVWSFSERACQFLKKSRLGGHFFRPFALTILIISAIIMNSIMTIQPAIAAHSTNVAIDGSASYVAQRLKAGDDVVILLSSNQMSPDLVAFELTRFGVNPYVWIFPTVPVDVGVTAPPVDVNLLFSLIRASNTRFGILWIGSQNPSVCKLARDLSDNPHVLSVAYFGSGMSQVLVYEFGGISNLRPTSNAVGPLSLLGYLCVDFHSNGCIGARRDFRHMNPRRSNLVV